MLLSKIHVPFTSRPIDFIERKSRTWTKCWCSIETPCLHACAPRYLHNIRKCYRAVHTTLFLQCRTAVSTVATCALRLSKWLSEASDCGQLPCRMSRLTMLAIKLVYECAPRWCNSCPVRFRGSLRLDTSSTFSTKQKQWAGQRHPDPRPKKIKRKRQHVQARPAAAACTGVPVDRPRPCV